MKKNITFMTHKKGCDCLKPVGMEVDLSVLSPLAHKMAREVDTTDQRDDLSHIGVRCRYTMRELAERVLKDTSGRYGYYDRENAKKTLRQAAWYDIDVKQSTYYLWDCLRVESGESPEQYFERHAKYVIDEHYPYLRDGELVFRASC